MTATFSDFLTEISRTNSEKDQLGSIGRIHMHRSIVKYTNETINTCFIPNANKSITFHESKPQMDKSIFEVLCTGN